MRVLVIDPGHGSVWVDDAEFHGDRVEGVVWDDSDRGSALLPDDHIAMPVNVTYPRKWILRTEGEVAE